MFLITRFLDAAPQLGVAEMARVRGGERDHPSGSTFSGSGNDSGGVDVSLPDGTYAKFRLAALSPAIADR